MRIFLAAVMLTVAAAAQAAPLTVHTGETWLFTLKDGQPTSAHQAKPTAKPAQGEVMVSVRALFGTSMIATNNSRGGYTFSAELLQSGKASAARTCTLPAGGSPILEQWPQKAEAVRISNFHATGPGGRC